MRKNYKPMIIGILCALIVVMAVGFALLREQLTITGTSHIDSNWNIRITNIRVKSLNSAYASGDNASKDNDETVVGDCTTKTVKNGPCDSTSANFDAKLVTPGDSITYEVTITNSGNLDGVVESINLECTDNEAIQCTTSGLNVADTISHTSPNNTNTVDVTVTYNNATTTQPANTNSTITLTINYQQDLGQVTVTYPTYSVGDSITYKGAAWRVIKNSTASEDYVTLIKETVLTNVELGEYAYNRTYDTLKFSDISNVYATSNVIKAAIEAYMADKGMASDLTEIDGYKIRLITKDELIGNLGYKEETYISAGNEQIGYNTENVPTWVYTNFGEGQNNVYGYWTMTPEAKNALQIWTVDSRGHLGNELVGFGVNCGARPVINLLKSAIPSGS